MSQPPRPIMIISGTNRPGSNTRLIAGAVERHYKSSGTACEMFSLAELPCELFSAEAYARKPAGFAQVQQRVYDAAGLHIILPEYNGSFPGVLKYFVDMLKFPESFEGKPVAFIGVTTGMWGALRAVEQLQLVFGYRNAYVYPERIFIPSVKSKLDEQGHVTDADLESRLARQCKGFAEFALYFASKIPLVRPM